MAANRARKATRAEKAVKKAGQALPTRKATARKGTIVERAKVAQHGPTKGALKTRTANQAHIAALVDPSTLDEWDDEELERGYRKDKNGRFTGRPPVQVPMVVAQEMQRRAAVKMMVQLTKLGPKALRTLDKVLDGDDDRAKVAASKLIMDRALPVGKHDTLDVSVKAEPAFLQALQGAIVIGSADDDIIDAEVVEDSLAS